jgi:hydroxypyruvate reductase
MTATLPPDPLAFLKSLYDAAVASVQPDVCLAPHLPSPPTGRLIVVGAGKAAAAMAAVVEECYPHRLEGLVIVPDGYSVKTENPRIAVIEASHPVPDVRGEAAAAKILSLAQSAGPGDMVLALISGGASALMTLPVPGVTLDDKRAITTALLRSGADIAEINCVRKHLSAIKGGHLAAAAAPAPVFNLIISDVIGDDPAVIASGPCVPDPTTCADALAVLDKYDVTVPFAIRTALKVGDFETPKENDGDVTTRIVARPSDALAAAATAARREGLTVLNLGDHLDGDARVGAAAQAALVRAVQGGAGPVQTPCVILSGGEYVVTVKGAGRGGPNTEFALALAVELEGSATVWGLAADTDGRDGAAGAAGALIGPDTLRRVRTAGWDIRAVLAGNDSAGVFASLGDLLDPGPTYTNVNDFRAILVGPA